jgi:hypothetical protein
VAKNADVATSIAAPNTMRMGQRFIFSSDKEGTAAGQISVLEFDRLPSLHSLILLKEALTELT